MRTLHIKKGEYIYLVHNETGMDFYKILLIDCDNPEKEIEVGLFDCQNFPESKMQQEKLNLGQRVSLFSDSATINALKIEFHGVTFAVSAPFGYRIENDYLRKRTNNTQGKKWGCQP